MWVSLTDGISANRSTMLPWALLKPLGCLFRGQNYCEVQEVYSEVSLFDGTLFWFQRSPKNDISTTLY